MRTADPHGSASRETALKDAFAHCAGLVREEDRPRYAARLFLPEPARNPVLALDAFRLETLKIPFLTSEAGPAEIRLQWWREVIEGGRESEAAGRAFRGAMGAPASAPHSFQSIVSAAS